ncbi:uncharacterized protein LOC120440656 [Oreochromis aureus]|uniref:uncharacterized protein LOC120440656 n=1 Tax=Oreochromis aureus TaxID=47969 RepID=UPI001953CCA1|nr:uncharacterized protein LOC120440656 [Oreochromis aureus]
MNSKPQLYSQAGKAYKRNTKGKGSKLETIQLAKQKVGVVRKLCKACNIDSKGSRFYLITRLREKMKSRQTYDKVFQSIWGASGGWSVILCPHGIVYSVKFNLRAESPRDFADLLLSWKHMPNVCVYDFARGLVAHTNLRVPDKLPFHPHEGRLAEPTEENVKAAQDGSLKVNLPWLHERMDSVNENPHPVTGSSDHYVLYDRFHEGNTKDPKDILHRILSWTGCVAGRKWTQTQAHGSRNKLKTQLYCWTEKRRSKLIRNYTGK